MSAFTLSDRSERRGAFQPRADVAHKFLEIIAELAQRVLLQSDLFTLMEEIAIQVVATLEVDYYGVFELCHDSAVLQPSTGKGWRERSFLNASISLAESSWAESILNKSEPVAFHPEGNDVQLEMPLLLSEHGVLSGITVPILGLDKPYGILGAYTTRKRRFDTDEVEFLQAIARLVAQAVRFAQPDQDQSIKHAMLRVIAHQIPTLVWTTDTDLRVHHAIGAGVANLRSYKHFLGNTLFEFFDNHYMNFPPIAAHNSALRGRAASFQYRLDGLLLDIRVEPFRDAEQQIRGCIGVAVDISSRDHVQKQLRLLSTAVESAANAIVITNRDGEITWVNPAFTQLTGYSFEEALGQNPRFLKSGSHDETFYRGLWETVLSGQVWNGEMLNRRKDGSLYTEVQTITPVSDADRHISHFISIRQDVTEQKNLEEQFRQSQKLEAVGRLAGGVAHDFNNLLTAIIGFSDLLLTDLHGDDPRRPDLDSIKDAAERAASLTHQLLAFSRRQVFQLRVLDLNASITNLGKMLGRLIGEDIDLVTILDKSLGHTKADPGQVEQVIMNLVVNARDAMPRGGTLTIETENVQLDQAYYRKHFVVRPGHYVMLAVSDTGSGIDKTLLPHIFEPFFTTKEEMKGTGLGLSTVYGIVKQSEGYIFAYSEPNVGSTFKVYLPRVDDAPEIIERREEVRNICGSETILLVEDEDQVRRLARRILTANGYSVLEAQNGAEALRILRECKDLIHLMLTDVIMPVMGGPEVADQQSQLRPEMKVLYMSGYTHEAIARRGALEPDTAFIQKPFAKSTLLSKVREVLDAPANSGQR